MIKLLKGVEIHEGREEDITYEKGRKEERMKGSKGGEEGRERRRRGAKDRRSECCTCEFSVHVCRLFLRCAHACWPRVGGTEREGMRKPGAESTPFAVRPPRVKCKARGGCMAALGSMYSSTHRTRGARGRRAGGKHVRCSGEGGRSNGTPGAK